MVCTHASLLGGERGGVQMFSFEDRKHKIGHCKMFQLFESNDILFVLSSACHQLSVQGIKANS